MPFLCSYDYQEKVNRVIKYRLISNRPSDRKTILELFKPLYYLICIAEIFPIEAELFDMSIISRMWPRLLFIFTCNIFTHSIITGEVWSGYAGASYL